MTTILTDEQVENWRKILCNVVGPYAMSLSRAQIQAFRDNFQKDVERLPTRAADEFCTCDPKRMGYTRHMDDTVTCNHCGKLRKPAA